MNWIRRNIISKKRTYFLPWYGWLGLLTLLLGQIGLAFNVPIISIWFTPIMWTGYIFLGSGMFQRWTGRSWFSNARRELPFMALVSILVWLLFEVYNFHLKNWVYRGLPEAALWRDVGYFWSFSTIMPGVFITYKLAQLVWPLPKPQAATDEVELNTGPGWFWFILGLAMVIFPLLVREEIAAYLFGAVWLGFILLLDPINERIGLPSLRRQWAQRRWRATAQWLAAGLICGLIWEAWNFQAFQAGGAYWAYTIPSGLRLTGIHFGQMPIEGLLGFPPFALELRAFYLWLREMFGGARTLGPTLIKN